ncbi:hypothetical protein GF345_04715 [Candidatus Woesearchaeota archaeon]|nr:hypothetical protein [Candidatus Woesearchaeota archaeon]
MEGTYDVQANTGFVSLLEYHSGLVNKKMVLNDEFSESSPRDLVHLLESLVVDGFGSMETDQAVRLYKLVSRDYPGHEIKPISSVLKEGMFWDMEEQLSDAESRIPFFLVADHIMRNHFNTSGKSMHVKQEGLLNQVIYDGLEECYSLDYVSLIDDYDFLYDLSTSASKERSSMFKGSLSAWYNAVGDYSVALFRMKKASELNSRCIAAVNDRNMQTLKNNLLRLDKTLNVTDNVLISWMLMKSVHIS